MRTWRQNGHRRVEESLDWGDGYQYGITRFGVLSVPGTRDAGRLRRRTRLGLVARALGGVMGTHGTGEGRSTQRIKREGEQ